MTACLLRLQVKNLPIIAQIIVIYKTIIMQYK
jgi:hypothetical protein